MLRVFDWTWTLPTECKDAASCGYGQERLASQRRILLCYHDLLRTVDTREQGPSAANATSCSHSLLCPFSLTQFLLITLTIFPVSTLFIALPFPPPHAPIISFAGVLASDSLFFPLYACVCSSCSLSDDKQSVPPFALLLTLLLDV